MKKYYLPKDDNGRLVWISNFATKISEYAARLGITPAQIAQVETDRDLFAWIIGFINEQKTNVEALTAFKNQLSEGKLPLSALPVFGIAPPLPANALNDIFGRVRLMVRAIKGNAALTEAIADALGIIGEESEDDVNTWKPILKVRIEAGSPNILWTKGNSNGIKIWVDRGDGQGFKFLGTDTIPNFLDKHALPAQGQSVLWKYQAIYILDDEEVGEMSDVLEVSVKGRVE